MLTTQTFDCPLSPPTNKFVSIGVVTTAMIVLAVVIMMLKGMSPFAMYATMLLAVPPGMQDTYNSSPNAKREQVHQLATIQQLLILTNGCSMSSKEGSLALLAS